MAKYIISANEVKGLWVLPDDRVIYIRDYVTNLQHVSPLHVGAKIAAAVFSKFGGGSS